MIVDFLPNLYYEQNTEHDTPYYNPIKCSILFRHLRQVICYGEAMKIAGSKYSAQVLVPLAKHYGTDVVTQLGYGQRISWNDVIDAGATLRWEKRPYDGDREHNLYVEFDMTFRF